MNNPETSFNFPFLYGTAINPKFKVLVGGFVVPAHQADFEILGPNVGVTISSQSK